MNSGAIFGRQASVLCVLLAVAVAIVILTMAHQVQGLEEELGSLRRTTAAEQQKMHVLQAEFSFLAEPERLRRLSAAHLGLVPVEPAQLASLATLDKALQRTPFGVGGHGPAAGVQVAQAGERGRSASAIAARDRSRHLAARERAAVDRSR